jgi:hypothetical protein
LAIIVKRHEALDRGDIENWPPSFIGRLAQVIHGGTRAGSERVSSALASGRHGRDLLAHLGKPG